MKLASGVFLRLAGRGLLFFSVCPCIIPHQGYDNVPCACLSLWPSDGANAGKLKVCFFRGLSQVPIRRPPTGMFCESLPSSCKHAGEVFGRSLGDNPALSGTLQIGQLFENSNDFAGLSIM